MSIAKKHNEAIDLAERGFRIRKEDGEKAISLFKQAYLIEKEIAQKIELKPENEPSRSIFYRSAASLALNAKLFRDAEIMCSYGLIGSPPFEIAEELRDIFEQANFERHLSLNGISIEQNQFQVSFTGKEVGHGYIKSNEFIKRINIISDMATRELEFMGKKTFRGSGRKSKLIDMYPTYLNAQMAGSYKVIIQIGESKNANPLFGEKYDIEKQVIDSLISNIEMINNRDLELFSKKYSDIQISYRDFFLSSIKSLAPDGEKIKTINFTVLRNNQEVSITFNRKKKEIKLPIDEQKNTALLHIDKENEFITIEGILDLAKSKSSSKFIEVTDKKGKSHKIEISEGKLASIVRDNYEDNVKIKVVKKKKRNKIYYEFVDIENIG